MNDETADSDPDIEWENCDLCGESLNKFGTPRFAEVYRGQDFIPLDQGFCSWDHLAEWTRRGEPAFDRWSSRSVPSRRERFIDRFLDPAVFVLLSVWSLLASFGLYTLIRQVF